MALSYTVLARQHKSYPFSGEQCESFATLIPMAAPISSIESHPQRSLIIDAIASGRPLTEVASWTAPPVHRAALSRFKTRALAEHAERVRTAKAAISLQRTQDSQVDHQAVTAIALATAIDPFAQRCLHHQGTIDKAIAATEAGTGRDTIASLIGADVRSLELYAKLAGRLDQAPQATTTLNVYLGIPRSDPSRVIDGKVEPSDE